MNSKAAGGTTTSAATSGRGMKELPVWDFPEASRRSLDNEGLHEALVRATGKFDLGRKQIMSELPESELVRERARRIKDDTLAHLDGYVEQFADAVETAGGHVHWARTGDEANEIIAEIAAEAGVERIVKSKSMVSEETKLNASLLDRGFQVVETDLGEYILQISSDHPSHIVVPVVHRTKEEIADIFNRVFQRDLPPEPEKLTALAREVLREEFRLADMGITGANFAAADTGTVVQVTNEGNGRLSTTWPRVHVALMGIEKLIPRLADLPVFLKLLARSATGQPLTVYTNLITGPRREGEGDGAREMHVVLLDNGRTKVLGSKYREVLRCIRCGACLNTCPVYQQVGGHAYGSVYPGPIGSLLSPMYEGENRFKHLPHASSLCGACYDACPVKINIPQMLLDLRGDQAQEKATPLVERVLFRLWAMGMSNKLLYRTGAKLMRWGLAPWAIASRAPAGWTSRAPGPFAGWTEERDLSLPSTEPFHKRWARLENEAASET